MGCAVGHGGLTLRAQRWWERRGLVWRARGAHAKGAEVVGAQGGLFGGRGGLTPSGGGAESAGELVWRSAEGRCVSPWNGGFQPPPRAAYGNFFECRTK